MLSKRKATVFIQFLLCAICVCLSVTLTTCFRRQVSWQRVFILLKDGCLFLFESPRDLQPLQTLPLYAACCIFPQFPKVTRSNCLQVETPTASLILCADSPAEISSWAIHIQKAAILASGGSIGKLHALPAVPSTTLPASSQIGSYGTPHRQRTMSINSRIGPPISNNSLTLEFPSDHASTSLSNATNTADSLATHSAEAASLLSEAAAAAAYDHVLHRFRNVSTITAFTSNNLACLAASGAYAAKYRCQAKRRIASEWLAETRAHTIENQRRQSYTANSMDLEVNMDYLVPSLGTLQLSTTTIQLHRGVATLSATNTADYPIALRIGDNKTDLWLQTNTPCFIAPNTTINIDLTTATALATLKSSAASSSTAQSGASASSTSTCLQPVPSSHSMVTLVVKPCDASDLQLPPVTLFEFDHGDSAPTHRIGEKLAIEVIENTQATGTTK